MMNSPGNILNYNYFLAFFIALMAGILFMPLFKDFAIKKNMLSRPKPPEDNRRLPYIGGLVIFVVFSMGVMVVVYMTKIPVVLKELKGIIISSAIITALGLYDDYRELKVLPKFLGQIIAALCIAGFGIRTHIIHIGETANYIITIIWLLGMINAFNFLDISDGLCAGIALIASIAFFIIALITNNSYVALKCAVLTGALAVFLKYNLPPAKIFMGDTGSMLLGAILAAVALEISYAPVGHAARLVTPIIIMAVPIFDILFLIFMRLKNGRSIINKSPDHFIFLLNKTNIARGKNLKFMYEMGMLSAIAALVVNLTGNTIGIAIFILLILIYMMIGANVNTISNE